MSTKKVFLKVAAFVPAIVLVGGFVGVRAGMIQVPSKPEPPPEAEPTTVAPLEKPATGDEVPTYMPGSKSIVFTTQIPAGPKPPGAPNSTPPTQASPEKPPIVMYSSKSAPVFNPIELIPGNKPTTPPAAPPNAPKP